MPHRRQRIEREEPDQAGDDDAAVLCRDRERRDGEEGPCDNEGANAGGRRYAVQPADGGQQCDVAQQHAADHQPPLFVEMGVEVVPRLRIVGKDQARRDEIDRGDDEAAEQDRPVQRQQLAQAPSVHPEGHDVARHEQAEQRGRPADADAVAGLERARQPAQPLGQRKTQDQAEKGKAEFEPRHMPPA